jgi:hypothetical protein
MAQPIKYNTGTTKTAGCCIRKGNFEIGVVTNREYGPTSTTGFWSGYNVPSGGFVSFQNKTAQGPSIYSISGVTELVKYGENLNLGGVYDTPEAVIQRCAELNTIVMTNIEYPEIPSIDNNILTLDAGYTASYPWGGNIWYNVAGGSVLQGQLTGNATWSSGSSINNFSDSVLGISNTPPQSGCNLEPFGTLDEFTISIWFSFVTLDINVGSKRMVIGQLYSNNSSYTPQDNCNFLIRGVDGSYSYEGLIRLDNTDYTVSFGTLDVNTKYNLVFSFNSNRELVSYVGEPGVGFSQINVTSGPPEPLVSNGLNTWIGGSINGLGDTSQEENFAGQIYSAYMWDRAIEQTELENMFNTIVTQKGF